MQTFLPCPSFKASVEKLDNKRLGKQRIEARQIIEILDGEVYFKILRGGPAKFKKDGTLLIPWKNHPAVKMWDGYVTALKHYYNECILEWTSRGFKNSMPLYKDVDYRCCLPHWLGEEDFHRSHKSNLIRKKPEHYGKFWTNIPADLPYVWPTN